MPHRLITTTEALSAFCEHLAHEPYIALDTEFIREKTYYPHLCLVQIAGAHTAHAIDPLAQSMDLTPLTMLLANPSILKVVHAGRQDMEIFYYLTGAVPTPLFDTQIAAQVCGFGESVAYSELVSRLLSIRIDKSSRYTDWAKRPLSDRQIAYALDDVIHLRGAYEKLRELLAKNNRLEWIAEEHAVLASPATYASNPRAAWEKLKAGNMRPKQLAALRELAAWREEEARSRDVPRGRILRDETLLEIAASLPQSEAELRHIRGLGSHVSTRQADALLGCVSLALALPPEEWPEEERRKRSEASGDLVALLQLLLKLKCSEHGITSRLVAGRDDLEKLALGHDAPSMHGWRREVFGAAAEKLIQGELTIAWDAGSGEVRLKE